LRSNCGPCPIDTFLQSPANSRDWRAAYGWAMRRGTALARGRVITTAKGEACMKHTLTLKTVAGIACMTFALAASAQSDTNGSTAPAASSETVGQHVDDATITTKVKADLLAANNVKSEHIHVKTRKGIVSLTGSVPTAEDRDNAKQVAENVGGVTAVKNHLKVVTE
jgi:hyperosmotically inducible periplasmic protein